MEKKELQKRSSDSQSIISQLEHIKVVALDVDGVLTDGLIHLDQKGREIKTFHALDGLGIVLAKSAGLKVVFISARESMALALRAHELGIDALYQNRPEKRAALEELLIEFGVRSEEVCYVGDDLIDIPILKRVGFPVAVQNAVKEVKDCCVYITQREGGKGAVREVIEKIMKSQGTWKKVIERYVQFSE